MALFTAVCLCFLLPQISSSFAIRCCLLFSFLLFSSGCPRATIYRYLCFYYVLSPLCFGPRGFGHKIYRCLCLYRVFLLTGPPQTLRCIIIYFPILFSLCQSGPKLRYIIIYVYIQCSLSLSVLGRRCIIIYVYIVRQP